MKPIKVTKAHRICFVLLTRGLTRVDVMKRVHRLEGKPDETFSPTSNHSYWTSTGGGNGGHVSVVFKGLVRIAGKRGNAFTYELTDAGRALVTEYILAGNMG